MLISLSRQACQGWSSRRGPGEAPEGKERAEAPAVDRLDLVAGAAQGALTLCGWDGGRQSGGQATLSHGSVPPLLHLI